MFVAEDDVVKDGHRLDEHEVLMHHADAKLDRLARRFDADLLPVQKDLALSGLVEADEDIHERRFPRAVLSEERMYLALGDGEIDVLIGVKVAEPFADVLHAQQFTQSRLPPFFS